MACPDALPSSVYSPCAVGWVLVGSWWRCVFSLPCLVGLCPFGLLLACSLRLCPVFPCCPGCFFPNLCSLWCILLCVPHVPAGAEQERISPVDLGGLPWKPSPFNPQPDIAATIKTRVFIKKATLKIYISKSASGC